MVALIEMFQKELSDILCFAADTVENYVSCIVMFCEFLKNTFNISPVHARGTHLQKWIYALKDTGISSSRMEHHRSALKSFYAMLQKMDLVTENPAQTLPAFRKRHLRTVHPVASQTVWKLLDTVDRTTFLGKRNYLIIAMLWALGLRISELTGLTLGSFEPEHDPKKKIGLLRVKGKNLKHRALFVVDDLYDLLLAYIAHEDAPKRKKDPLFPVKSGKAISTDRIQRMIKETCRTAGIRERITPHVLRHSFATEMYHAKVPLDAIQDMMGHSKTAETAIYIKVDDELKKEVLSQLCIDERMI